MKAAINSLALNLFMQLDVPVASAMAFAEQWVADNLDLFENVPRPVVPGTRVASATAPAFEVIPQPEAHHVIGNGQVIGHVVAQPGEALHGTYVPVKGPDGLTDVQRGALSTVGLCSNCQQPNNDHLPGCAVASGEDRRAVTKSALPPVQ